MVAVWDRCGRYIVGLTARWKRIPCRALSLMVMLQEMDSHAVIPSGNVLNRAFFSLKE